MGISSCWHGLRDYGPGGRRCTPPLNDHELHFIDVPDELCKAQLRERSRDLPAGTAWTTEAEFEAITKFFQPPTADEGFNIIRHERA